MKVFVTGGAGYVGSHVVRTLVDNGHEVLVYDNLSTGPSEALWKGVRFHLGDVRDHTLMGRIMKDAKVDAVIHLAGKLNIKESFQNPLDYYDNNLIGTYSVVKAMETAKVRMIHFASSASVYGDPKTDLVTEEGPTHPLNPYGQSKLMAEQILRDASKANGIQYCILRYFNVAGAAANGENGQRTNPAYHLVHVAAQAAAGKISEVSLFGSDYPTPDGSCVRDYIHVEDIADIHLLGLKKMSETSESFEFNCGNNRGYSAREVLEMMKKVSGRDFTVSQGERQTNDITKLVANTSKLEQTWRWQPRRDSLELLCRSAYDWEMKRKVQY